MSGGGGRSRGGGGGGSPRIITVESELEQVDTKGRGGEMTSLGALKSLFGGGGKKPKPDDSSTKE